MTTERQTAGDAIPARRTGLSRRAIVAGVAVCATTMRARPAGAVQPTATVAGEEAAVSLYYVDLAPNRVGPRLRPWRGTVTIDPADRRVAAAALELLLGGPDDDARDGDGVTAIPDGVQLRSAELVTGGVVRVDLSGDFQRDDAGRALTDRLATPAAGQNRPDADRVRRLRQAQIVFTLTQFETVTGVELRVDGQPAVVTDFLGNPIDGPVTRDAFEDVTPLILIEQPLPLDPVPATFTVSGSSNTFEGSLFLRLATDDGDVLLELLVQATSGSGVRGTFSADLTIPEGTPAGALTLLGYELSARDGSEVNAFEVPLRFDPATP